jgi:hypothetical protein
MWICPEGYVQLISHSGTSYVAASLVTISVSPAHPYLIYSNSVYCDTNTRTDRGINTKRESKELKRKNVGKNKQQET